MVTDHDLNMYLSSSKNKLVSKNQRVTKVIQEVVPPEVPKLNHAVMNKKQRDQMQVFSKKRLEKRKWIHPTQYSTSRWIVV